MTQPPQPSRREIAAVLQRLAWLAEANALTPGSDEHDLFCGLAEWYEREGQFKRRTPPPTREQIRLILVTWFEDEAADIRHMALDEIMELIKKAWKVGV